MAAAYQHIGGCNMAAVTWQQHSGNGGSAGGVWRWRNLKA